MSKHSIGIRRLQDCVKLFLRLDNKQLWREEFLLFQWLVLLFCCGNDPLEKQSFCCLRAGNYLAGFLTYVVVCFSVCALVIVSMHECMLASYYMEFPFEPTRRVTFY